ncbi:serine threonine kinase 10, partial [Clonorchis sinensis]
MAFLKGLLKKIKGPDEAKKKSSLDKVRRDIDPDEVWEVIGELGDGAYGKVYKRKGETLTALKKVEFDSEVALEDFMVEIDILTEFKHPNIISLLEVYIYDSKLWMFLELCDGGALDSIMTTLEKPLSERQIRFVAREVLAGLKFLHENLIIHRDMKAGNILLTSANEVKLADFGVSAFLANEKQKRDTFIGSPYWMAPEVIACEALKESPYNWKADVWSFGITLIELAQMRPPYNDINPTRVLLKITKSDPPTLAKPRFWSTEFSDLLARCLQKDPNKRAECSELLSDPFVANLSEKDRECIKLLMCELKADVIDTVEESDSVELEDEEESAEENILILPDSTKIEVPMEVVDEDEENYDNETKARGELLDLGRATENQPFEVAPQKPDESLLQDLAQDLSDQLIGEVITSETRHPSVPSCLFEVMRDISEEVGVGQTIPEEDRLPPQPIVPKPPASEPKLSRRASAHKSLTRTRRFVVDGKVITTTTKHIIPVNAEVLKQREEDLNSRKAELRAFRMLGKQEARQTRELTAKAVQQKEQLETKLATEFLALKRGYEQKLEVVSRNYRAQLERLEKEYETDSKRIRSTTVKEGQTFKEQLRKELDKCSRAERKMAMRELNSDNSLFSGGSTSLSASLTSLNSLHSNSSQKSVISQQLLSFREQQGVRFTSHMKQLTLAFQERLYHLREEELVEKHTIRMNFEQEKWKMEQRHMHMRHQLSRSKLQDFFSIKRQKLAGLLELELYELRQTITREREKLNNIHSIERKNQAKYVKNMQKKNMTDFHRHCRLDPSLTASRLKERLRE